MRNARFDFGREELDFSAYTGDNGNSAFGLVHPRGLDLRPDLPLTTHELVGIDLTHRIDMSDIASAQGGGGGKPGGSGGGLSFANYTAGPATASAGYNITIEFKGSSWSQALHDVFVDAANRLTTLIIGEIPNVTTSTSPPSSVPSTAPGAFLGRRGRPRSAPPARSPPPRACSSTSST
jgi:hypothetical protein